MRDHALLRGVLFVVGVALHKHSDQFFCGLIVNARAGIAAEGVKISLEVAGVRDVPDLRAYFKGMPLG